MCVSRIILVRAGKRLCLWIICLSLISCSGNKEEKTVNQSVKIAPSSVTFNEHIAPLIYQNCTPCHRKGQSGPFELLTYNDAKKRAKQIKFVTGTRYMPPWPADAEYTHFANERRLSEEQIEMIRNWVDNGCKQGTAGTEPPLPVFNDSSWFGKPDMVIRPIEPVKIKGNGTDAFIIVKFPYELKTDTLVDFIEFVPHQKKLVHHVNGHTLSYDENRETNYFTGKAWNDDTNGSYESVFKDMGLPYTDGAAPRLPTLTPNTIYYLPGYTPPVYPAEIGGYKLKRKGVFLLKSVHYGPSNNDVLDSSYINVFFRKQPIERPISETQLGTFGISPVEPELIIPANTVKTFHTKATIANPISILSVNPHMHLIGKSFWAFAIKPNGDTIPLIRLNKWDFRWQYYYTYKHPVKIEANTTIHVYGTFDNTAANPFNPFHPARTITYGNGIESMRTTEEMFQFIFSYLPYRQGDEQIDLERKLQPHQ